MTCKKETNSRRCTCTYEPCSNKGVCCACLAFHLASRQLPACGFSADADRTFDRSFEHFARLVASGAV